VKRVSGLPLDEFADEEIFGPAGMKSTTFKPKKARWPQCAPQEKRQKQDDEWIIGEVHDPRAFELNGVAGHAGLFSTADDLSRYCRMILAGGEIDGRQILSPLTVRLMTNPRPECANSGVRGLGWDIATQYSSARGDLFGRYTSFGHTGFTGTSMWLDPTTGFYVIILTNRLHPDGKGDVRDLRCKIATVVASAIRTDAFDRPVRPDLAHGSHTTYGQDSP
jgi:CubicO group peptidase (beta-lactamase class C family)